MLSINKNPSASAFGDATSLTAEGEEGINPAGPASSWSNLSLAGTSPEENSKKPRLSREEVNILEAEFQKNPRPSSHTKKKLAEDFRVEPARVNNWFQNRRAREKKEQSIKEYEAKQSSALAIEDTEEHETRTIESLDFEPERGSTPQTASLPPFARPVDSGQNSRAMNIDTYISIGAGVALAFLWASILVSAFTMRSDENLIMSTSYSISTGTLVCTGLSFAVVRVRPRWRRLSADPTSWRPLNSTRRFILGTWDLLLENMHPRPLPGHVRVSWSCNCGRRIRMTASNRNRQRTIAFAYQATANTDSVSIVDGSGSGRPASDSSTAADSAEADIGLAKQDSTTASLDGSITSTMHPFISKETKRFMLLCAKRGPRLIKMANVDVTNVSSDDEIFSKLRMAYGNLRGLSMLNRLIKPRKMHYIKFDLLYLQKSGECVSDYMIDSIPSRKEILQQEYAFSPCPPLNGILPLPADIFMHIFLTPGDHLGDLAAEILPKKLYSGLSWNKDLHSIANRPTGWGYYIVEGIDWLVVAWGSIVAGFGITVLTIAWSLRNGDVQGGTGIGQFCIALIAFWLSVLVLIYKVGP